MALRLMGAGFSLVVHSRSPEPVEELKEAGADVAGTPADVAAAADVVITIVPDTPDVELVLFGPDGVASRLQRGGLVIDMSTIDPLAARRFGERLQDGGADLLDAPVSGGDIGARDGTLSIKVGGSSAALARAMPLLTVLGKTIVHVGEPGAGQMAKACNQLVIASELQAVAEAFVLAEGFGADPAKVRAALLGGFASSRVLEVHGQRMLDRTFVPGFRTELHLKDARIVRSLATQLGVELQGFEPALRSFGTARRRG